MGVGEVDPVTTWLVLDSGISGFNRDEAKKITWVSGLVPVGVKATVDEGVENMQRSSPMIFSHVSCSFLGEHPELQHGNRSKVGCRLPGCKSTLTCAAEQNL